MPEHSAAALQRPTAERREGSLTERIWHGADTIVEGTLQRAQNMLEQEGLDATPDATVDLAYTLQLRHLDKASQKDEYGQTEIDDWSTGTLTANRIALLTLSMPAAGRAQRALNATDYRHGTRNEHLIGVLSDFNGDLANALAHMPQSMMADFPERLLLRSQNVLQNRWDIESMKPEDLYRSLRGVKREVAFWRAAHNNLDEDWAIRQSTTQEDIHGTDFIITNPEGQEMRVDVKAGLRFQTVVDKLLQGRWISREDADHAYETGYVYNPNTDRNGARDGTYTCIFDADRLGDITNYQYENQANVVNFIVERFQDRKATAQRKVGRYAVAAGHRSI
jgi:hypothetical protein